MGMLDFIKPKGMGSCLPEEGKVNRDNEMVKLYNIYNNKAPWVDNVVTKSLNLGKTITKEVKKTSMSEFYYTVDMVSEKTTQLDRSIADLKRNGDSIVTNLLIGGKVLIKPYIINGGSMGLSVVNALNYKAKYYSSGDLKTVLITKKYTKKDKHFTLYEELSYIKETKQYSVSYSLYVADKSTEQGKQTPLTSLDEVSNLHNIVFEGVSSHLCVEGRLEDPIYSDAVELIKDADEQYSKVLWEYSAGEMAIDVSADLLKSPGSSNIRGVSYDLPKGKERLYRKMVGATSDFGMEHWAPDLRDEDYWRGLEKILRRIEFACGLSYGILSESSDVAKTATEIIASKQRFYVTVSTVQSTYKKIISETLSNCFMFQSLVNPPFVNLEYNLTFSVDDNILSTRTEKIDEKIKLLDKGIITLDEFKEWYRDM